MNTSVTKSIKKNARSIDNLSEEIAHLLNSINNIRHQSNETLEFKSSKSTLGKFYELFSLLKNNKNIFDDLMIKQIDQLNKSSLNFIQFMKQIDSIAKQNQITKEYLYQKVSLLKN
jgi:methyl-accepting chemotaxis protein